LDVRRWARLRPRRPRRLGGDTGGGSVDGEAVVLGVDGVSNFEALRSRQHDDEVQLYAFDVLAIGEKKGAFAPSIPVVPVMPAVPAPVRMRPVIAIGAVPVWTMPAAAPGVAHPAHLLDVRGLTRDLARLRQSIRHCGSRSCRERHAAECSQTNNNSFHGHGFLLLRNPELRRDQLVAATSVRGARFNLGEHSFSLDEVIFARAHAQSRMLASYLPLNCGLRFFHECLAALAEILAVHAGRADVLHRFHIAVAGIFQHLRDGELGGLDRKRRIGGEDLRPLPLHLRKNNLAQLLARRPDGIFVAPFEQGEIGSDLFRAACNMGLEGMVSKRVDRPYRAGRSKDWIVKNLNYPAMDRVMESF
jgi:hypothetical protein